MNTDQEATEVKEAQTEQPENQERSISDICRAIMNGDAAIQQRLDAIIADVHAANVRLQDVEIKVKFISSMVREQLEAEPETPEPQEDEKPDEEHKTTHRDGSGL